MIELPDSLLAYLRSDNHVAGLGGPEDLTDLHGEEMIDHSIQESDTAIKGVKEAIELDREFHITDRGE